MVSLTASLLNYFVSYHVWVRPQSYRSVSVCRGGKQWRFEAEWCGSMVPRTGTGSDWVWGRVAWEEGFGWESDRPTYLPCELLQFLVAC